MSDPSVLWITPVSNLAGVARHIIDVARVGLPGYRLVVTAPEGPLLDALRELDCAVHPLDLEQPLPRVVADLRRTIREVSPVIVHSHLAKADFLVAMATPGLPLRLISTEHHIPEDPLVFHGTKFKAITRQLAHHARIRRFSRLIAVSESTKRDMLKFWWPSAPVTVVLNAVDRPDPTPERTPGLRILSLSRLSQEKNVEMSLRAFSRVLAEHPDATLTIGGTGDEEPSLIALAEELALTPSVTFAGFIDAAEAMREHDVLVQPSRADNLSYSLLDAVAEGMGVVASDIGGNGEILPRHCLVALGDDVGMADAIVRQGQRIGERPSLPSTIPTVAHMARQITEIYAGLLTEAPPERRAGERRFSTADDGRLEITFASNQGEMGGGEVMLLNLARAARELGHTVRVAAPASPSELLAAAQSEGFDCVPIPGATTRGYLFNLRRWDATRRTGLLWCNGLRPAFATAGRTARVVHLHQQPLGRLRTVARFARVRALVTLVPSELMASRIPGSRALQNWTQPLPRLLPGNPPSEPVVIGYIGRLSSDKGVPTLARAVSRLADQGCDIRLVLAGTARFVDADDDAVVREALEALGDRVERLGWVSPSEFFDRIDLAVFPSSWEEPFGLVVAEAMSACCPFVITDAGALPEVAGTDYPFIARRDDAVDLSEVIDHALTFDEWPELVRASFHRWENRFSPQAGTERIRQLLGGLTRDHGGLL